MTWSGVVADGAGTCAKLMDGAWLDAAEARLGYRPLPGSLNLNVDRAVKHALDGLPGVDMRDVRGEKRYHPVTVDGHGCHAKIVGHHDPVPRVELVSRLHLRTLLGVGVGDRVEFAARLEPRDVDGILPEPIGDGIADLASDVPSHLAIVEVGSFKGRSTCYLASRAEAHVWAVDAWDLPGNFDGAGHPFTDPSTREAFHANVAACGLSDRVTAVQGWSADVARRWDGPPVGLLFLDARHSYDAVKGDYEAWCRHLTTGAKVAFDDAATKRFGVERFVTSLGLPVERHHDGRLAVVRP